MTGSLIRHLIRTLPRGWAGRYGFAVAAAALAVLVRLALDPVWGTKLPFITSYPAVIMTAWFGGFGPGMVTTVLGVAAAAYFWMPGPEWAVSDTGDALALASFVAIGAAIALGSEARRRARARVTTETETTRALFNSAAEGIVIVDQAGRIVRSNTRLAQMFGYSASELVGQPLEMLLPDRFRAAHGGHRVNYFSAPRARSMGLGLDLYGLRKDGFEFPVEISLSPIETAAGSAAMALVTDISERRSVELATRQREKLATLATLSAGIAHELNNPIGIISSRVELMLQDAVAQPLPDQVVEDLKVLHRNIERVTTIARGLLSFARQAPDETTAINLNVVIEETLMLLGRPLAKDGVQVKTALDRALGLISGNGNALQQVLTNLLLNARDAMPRGGEVRIETTPDRTGWLRLTIADTGDGMTPEVLAKIWEPFYTTKTSGTGLGLAVTHRIIREHGGTVEVQSAPGSGTTFTIMLPLQAGS
jgi:PAS domain S-box-containing protein